MVKPIDMGLIQARRKKIAEEYARLAEAMDALKNEEKELAVAERVFAKLSGAGDSRQRKGSKPNEPSGKPEGTPPVPIMIKEALAHALTLGAIGLKPGGLLSYIQGKWWPGVQANAIGPIAWRMAERKELMKLKSGEYALLDAERAKILDEIKKAEKPAKADFSIDELETLLKMDKPSIFRRL